MKPRVEFGCPVQRAKNVRATRSWWHIPVTIHDRWFGGNKLEDCLVFLQDHGGGKPGVRLEMRWGDMSVVTDPDERMTLRVGEVSLVPIVTREETGNDHDAYITEEVFFSGGKVWPILGDEKKRKFKIGVSTGKYTAMSRQFYLVRVPPIPSNGQFLLEVEFKGGGTLPVPLEHRSVDEENG